LIEYHEAKSFLDHGFTIDLKDFKNVCNLR